MKNAVIPMKNAVIYSPSRHRIMAGPGDTRTMRAVAEDRQIFEGRQDEVLVRLPRRYRKRKLRERMSFFDSYEICMRRVFSLTTINLSCRFL